MRALLGGLALALALGACAPAESGDRDAGSVVEFVYLRHGGLCPGPEGGQECRFEVTVRDDGTWSAVGGASPGGAVPPDAASGLATILEQGWRQLTLITFTDTCPRAYDGQEEVYTIRRLPTGPGAEFADGEVREVRSCTYDLEHVGAREVLDRLNEAWETLGLPR